VTGNQVIIIGGGVIGAASAYYLAREGCRVTVLERGQFGNECSHANCGLVAPSHVLPLNEPGATGKAVRALLSRNAPFTIRPRFDPTLWWWFVRFAARANERDMLASARARRSLLDSSWQLYHQLLEDESIDCEWEDRGCYFVFESEAGANQYRNTDRLLREHFDLGAEWVDGHDLVAREPILKPGVAGAFYYAHDSHLRPDRLMAGLRRSLTALNVDIREDTTVRGIDSAGGRARAVVTDRGEVTGDHVVVAAGALSPVFQRELGCRLPIQPGKGYSLTMPRPATCPTSPMIFQEDKVAVTPMRSGFRLGSTMEFAGYDTRIHESRLDLLRGCARRHFSEALPEPEEEEWYGWRPMTIDGRPIIDRSPRLENAYIAAGHNMLGLSMAPSTGKLLSELVVGKTPHVDPEPYRVTRL
jgi:D-amino-acid dehydrogenase